MRVIGALVGIGAGHSATAVASRAGDRHDGDVDGGDVGKDAVKCGDGKNYCLILGNIDGGGHGDDGSDGVDLKVAGLLADKGEGESVVVRVERFWFGDERVERMILPDGDRHSDKAWCAESGRIVVDVQDRNRQLQGTGQAGQSAVGGCDAGAGVEAGRLKVEWRAEDPQLACRRIDGKRPHSGLVPGERISERAASATWRRRGENNCSNRRTLVHLWGERTTENEDENMVSSTHATF